MKYLFPIATFVLTGALAAPAVASPATAWEDRIFAPQPSGNEYAGGLFHDPPTHNMSYDMFSSIEDFPLPYQPNYVAPPAGVPTYVSGGESCRSYSQVTRVGTQVRETYGTACLQPDGNWKVVP